MIYLSADDYGISPEGNARIEELVSSGVLNKVSLFENFGEVDLDRVKKALYSLHLNLVEGKSLTDPEKIPTLANSDGLFKYTFFKLFLLSIFKKKKLEGELLAEIRSQIERHVSLSGERVISVDSHQHTHMIPLVFRTLLRALDEEGVEVGYMRLPAEPISPFLKAPSLYFTYSAVNIIKQWLLNALWQVNKASLKGRKIPTALFFGILFSGRMDALRVERVLPHFIALAEKKGCDLEVLFHPAYLTSFPENARFREFYLSENRKTEFESVKKIKERSVF